VVQPLSSPRTPGDNLMDQCSLARHPTRATGGLTNQPGHDLELGVDTHSRVRQCSPAGGSAISLPRAQAKTRQRRADRIPLGCDGE
jgi:hypothetical protein